MKKIIVLSLILLNIFFLSAQENNLERFKILVGDWEGTGTGFGNSTSTITASYKFVMNKKYMEVTHESNFKPTEEKPNGDHHIDHGFISVDKIRKKIIYRQFNNEGYVNQYLLNEELSSENELIFETEIIENFPPGGKARLTIKKISEKEIETIFDVSFPNKEYACFGINKLVLK
jgi:hypothetical protein